MPTLYLHSMAGELLLKTTVDAPAIKLIPPGLKAAVHILAARYIHPPLLEEWITLTWKNGHNGDIYVTYAKSLPPSPLHGDECAVCLSRGVSMEILELGVLCSRCGPADLCWNW